MCNKATLIFSGDDGKEEEAEENTHVPCVLRFKSTICFQNDVITTTIMVFVRIHQN